ncbi:aspartate kinase [Bacillus oleivorans]|uniref:Aspartokinase n=1 Tax=Bacillus oleivorans TaxID=1448271 RepID=A0A285CV87_9BACI|nr:aspartate kinase [Bacillus oleivorans]SNX71480.1 aspartate kinase [Bacillus oleivorans]
MGLIVQKFGGTSVATTERIRNVGHRVLEEVNKGHQAVVVVSAMGKTTDQLVSLANDLSAYPSKREMDMLLATGEQVTISLLSIALQEMGHQAVSLTGWQAGIQTEKVFSNARITDIDASKIQSLLNENQIVIVAGFQGVSSDGEITTLGRGGSDTTAVALAAALGADRCDIYTDVTGVYTSDPRYVKDARKLDRISYEEMLELAHLGAGVLHPRAVEFAKNYQIPLEVRSSMERERGTIIEEEAQMENGLVVRGVAFEKNVTRMTLFGLDNSHATLSKVFRSLAENHINVDIIIQANTGEKKSSLSFTIHDEDVQNTLSVLEKYSNEIGFDKVESETGLAKVSIVGAGMISNPGVAARMFEVIEGIDAAIKMVSTSEIKVSAVIEQEKMLDAANALHAAFKLGEVAATSVN